MTPDQLAYHHPEWAQFVAAVRANPGDDLPRLVAADWLAEHGEEGRAALIRAQCELARLPGADPGRRALAELADSIWRDRLRTNSRQFAGTGLLFMGGARWVRGFPEVVWASGAGWAAHGATVLTYHHVAEVRLTTLDAPPSDDTPGVRAGVRVLTPDESLRASAAERNADPQNCGFRLGAAPGPY